MKSVVFKAVNFHTFCYFYIYNSFAVMKSVIITSKTYMMGSFNVAALFYDIMISHRV